MLGGVAALVAGLALVAGRLVVLAAQHEHLVRPSGAVSSYSI